MLLGMGLSFAAVQILSDKRFKANAVHFTSATTVFTNNGPLLNTPDGKAGTLSLWIRLDDLPFVGSFSTLLGFGFSLTEAVSVIVAIADSTKKLRFTLSGAAGTVVDMVSDRTITAADGWVHVIAAWDAAAGVSQLYIDDIESKDEVASSVVNQIIDYSKGFVDVGAEARSRDNPFVGDMAEFWFDDVFIDLSVEANRRKFVSALVKPIFLGPDGSLPTGVVPSIFMSGATSTWGTNKGNAGPFFAFDLTTASSSPTD